MYHGYRDAMDKKAGEFIGGPYITEINKPYKPIFICFIDLIVAITYILLSLMYSWNKLDV